MKQNKYLEQTNFSPPRAKILADLLESLIIAALICAFVYIFVITPNIVHGPSMIPTFREGQLVLTTSRIGHWLSDTPLGDSLGLSYHPGDIIVFHTSSGEDLIKRVIAQAGDTVMLKDGHVFLNDEEISETYLDSSIRTRGGSYLGDNEEIIIPESHYFVMGDNRTESRDSRDLRVGLISKDDILGKVILRYWPIGDFSIIQPGEILL